MFKIARIYCLTGAALLFAAQSVVAEDTDPSTSSSTTTSSSESTGSGSTSTDSSSGSTTSSSTTTAPSSGTDQAREALATKEGDVTAEKNLEEVFQSAEKQYSLLKSGDVALNYSFGYSYFRNDRIDIAFNDSGSISRFLIEQDAAHTFSNSFSFDYGIWNNLTFDFQLPLSYKFDSSKNLSGATLGDISFGARWQPFALKRGAPVTTLFATVSTATGDSPYKINPETDLSGGKGYYAVSGGASVSKVIDPAVVFGSLSYTMGFDVTDLNQRRSDRTLIEFHPGDSIAFSLGMAHSLSYDLSLSVSYQQAYAFQSEYIFDDGTFVGSEDSTSASLSTSLGIRMSPQRIVNFSFGFGLTEEAADVSLGVSLPIDISGLKK